MAEKIKNFYELTAWKEAHELVLSIYTATNHFPRAEQFGITSQLRRASSSITANIAEGFARFHFKDKVRFYHQSRGSVAEVQNFLLLARDLKMIDAATCKSLGAKTIEVAQLINGMIRSIERQQ